MKKFNSLLLLLLVCSIPALRASDSKRTADYILTTPADFEGKEVSLDVAFVKPVHWQSPVPELAFFHAVTLDRRDRKPAGQILVAIPSADAAHFAKKYGTDFQSRNESDSLSGTLTTAPGKGPKRKVWIVDTTGQVGELVKRNQLSIVEEAGDDRPQAGGGFRRPRQN